jgi:hypothetical protein
VAEPDNKGIFPERLKKFAKNQRENSRCPCPDSKEEPSALNLYESTKLLVT